MKPHRTQSLCSELMDKRVFDEKAETTQEIAKAVGVSEWTAQRRIRKELESGNWEQVWKKGGRQAVPAYRVKKRSPFANRK